MSFKDQSFEARFAKMGDEAEAMYETVTEQSHIRYGLDRPPLKLSALPMRVRHAPDYLESDRFVEVGGYGRDGIFKLKLDKLSCLNWWDDLHPVDIFVWHTTMQRWCRGPLGWFRDHANTENVEVGWFPEGKMYFGFRTKHLGELGWNEV